MPFLGNIWPVAVQASVVYAYILVAFIICLYIIFFKLTGISSTKVFFSHGLC